MANNQQIDFLSDRHVAEYLKNPASQKVEFINVYNILWCFEVSHWWAAVLCSDQWLYGAV